jgi:hypothetical protein
MGTFLMYLLLFFGLHAREFYVLVEGVKRNSFGRNIVPVKRNSFFGTIKRKEIWKMIPFCFAGIPEDSWNRDSKKKEQKKECTT